jgi:PcaR/PcaU/PobR family beta-ketoadipate pathway transcriptional regulator
VARASGRPGVNGASEDGGAARSHSYGIQSVSRAFTILELFDERRPDLSTTEIAELTGLNRATAYRFCQTLLSLGYLEEVAPRRFRPGLKAVSLARAALSSRELPDLAQPYLRELRDAVGETVNMALLDGADVVYVARLLSHHLLALRLFVGSRLPAYASSLGRAMLAFLPDDEVEAILEGVEFQTLTRHTIVDRERLLAELHRVRSRGYAINDQELVLGIRGIAAPVFGVGGRPIAAINLSIAHPLSLKEIEAQFSGPLLETARAITDLARQLTVDVAQPMPPPAT